MRKKHSQFIYESFEINMGENEIGIKFNFKLDDIYSFHPTLTIPINKYFRKFDLTQLETFVFNIGMIELISYWKAACPAQIVIKPFDLTEEQKEWWKKIYFHGLGEFFYLNKIEVHQNNFVEIICESNQSFKKINSIVDEKVLVPIGGGKDSVVSLELLKDNFQVIPLILDPRGASFATIEAGELIKEDAFILHRTIDPKLLELNAKAYLNGHTPFSAMLAFNSVLASFLTGAKNIALSNESSANEPTDIKTGVNHQYSKSLEFETDFRWYINEYVWTDVNYFSFLRPLSELQIAYLFSKFDSHLMTFRSCNVGSKSDSWCGNCSKCLFTYIILLPFLEREVINKIFDKDLLMDMGLKKEFDELTGAVDVKPFECVGTTTEVNIALSYFISQNSGELPALLKYYSQSELFWPIDEQEFSNELNNFEESHYLSYEFVKILKAAIHD